MTDLTVPVNIGDDEGTIDELGNVTFGPETFQNASGSKRMMQFYYDREVTHRLFIEQVSLAKLNDPPEIVMRRREGRAVSTSTSGSHSLPVGTLTVVSTSGFPAAGSSLRLKDQIVSYTGISGNTFTGCSGGAGTIATGTRVELAAEIAGDATLTAQYVSGADGTIAVANTYPLTGDAGATTGIAIVQKASGNDTSLIEYTITSATQLTVNSVVQGTGITFPVGALITRTMDADATVGLLIAQPWQGRGGFQTQSHQIGFQLDEPARPDGQGHFHAAGKLIVRLATPGPFSQLADVLGMLSNGFVGVMGGHAMTEQGITNKLTVGGPGTFTDGPHTLPVSTLNVRSTAGFPSAGTVLVGGSQNVNYTAITPRSFTGCSGGSGAMGNNSQVALNPKTQTTVARFHGTVQPEAVLMLELGQAPPAVANGVQLYAQDSGQGRTQLMVRFGTGNPKVLAESD